MCRLNLKFKIVSEILVGNYMGVNHLGMSTPNLKFKIVRFWLAIIWEINNFSMSRLKLKFKIFTENLVGNYWGSVIFPCAG